MSEIRYEAIESSVVSRAYTLRAYVGHNFSVVFFFPETGEIKIGTSVGMCSIYSDVFASTYRDGESMIERIEREIRRQCEVQYCYEIGNYEVKKGAA